MKTEVIDIPTTYYLCDYCSRRFIGYSECEHHEKVHKQQECVHSEGIWRFVPFEDEFGNLGTFLEKHCSSCKKLLIQRGLSDTEESNILKFLNPYLEKYYKRQKGNY